MLKLISVFTVCFVFRLLPFRPPNVELILASQMPVAKQFGTLFAFLFGFLSIVLFDAFTGTLGPWSLITAPTYGLLGVGAVWYLKNREKTRYFVYFAIVGTLFYDVITGLLIGPLFFGQAIMAAALGQIPFTLMHMLGNVSFSLVWSKSIERWMANSSFFFFEKPKLYKTQNPNKAQNTKIPNNNVTPAFFSSVC